MFVIYKMLVIIDYKGKRLKKMLVFNNKKLKVYILITDKQNKNNYMYHFVCVLENDKVLIPNTSIIPKETSYIHLTFKDEHVSGSYEHKFNIPIHAIYSLGEEIPTSLNFSINL